MSLPCTYISENKDIPKAKRSPRKGVQNGKCLQARMVLKELHQSVRPETECQKTGETFPSKLLQEISLNREIPNSPN